MTSTLIFVLLAAVSYSEAGVSFIRWGRTVCPAGTHKLYQGYMAGPHQDSGGDGSNYLCLAQEPQFVRGVVGIQNGPAGAAGAIWGVEMQGQAILPNIFLYDNIPSGQQIANQDMVCVRCYVEGSFDVMMLPGRQDCYGSGYDLQYKGFLVSLYNAADKKRGEYVCLDEAPEGRPGGTADNQQGAVHPVEVICGSLPCNPYVQGMELTCAVCTY